VSQDIQVHTLSSGEIVVYLGDEYCGIVTSCVREGELRWLAKAATVDGHAIVGSPTNKMEARRRLLRYIRSRS